MTPIDISVLGLFAKKVIDWFKGKDKKAIYTDDQEEIKQLMDNIDLKEAHGNINIMIIKSTFSFINTKGDTYGIGKKVIIREALLDNLKREKEEHIEAPISLMESKSGLDNIDFQNRKKYVSPKLKELIEKLSPRFTTIIGLSIALEDLYRNKKFDEAERMREDIQNLKGMEWIRFADLWSRGYIKNLLNLIIENGEKLNISEVERQIDEVITRAESLFFIKATTSVDGVVFRIRGLIHIKVNYLGIHSLGSAKVKAQKIVGVVAPELRRADYIMAEGKKDKNGFSRFWYRGEEGLETYNLFKKLLS